MSLAVRGTAVFLMLQALWIGVSGVVFPIGLELVALESEPCEVNCVNGWVLALGDLAIGLPIGMAGVRLWAVGAHGPGTARWLAVAGVANLALAGFWAAMVAFQPYDGAIEGLPILAFVVVVAVLCFALAAVNRPLVSVK